MNLVVEAEFKSANEEFETLEKGLHDAICIDVVYPVIKQYQNEKPKNTVVLIFEVNKKRKRKDGGKDDEKNYQVWSKNYGMSLSPKSHLKPLLADWLERDLDKPGEEVMLEELRGKTAKIMTTQTKRKTGEGYYAKILSIAPGEVDFETDPNYEPKDPKDISDEVSGKVPF